MRHRPLLKHLLMLRNLGGSVALHLSRLAKDYAVTAPSNLTGVRFARLIIYFRSPAIMDFMQRQEAFKKFGKSASTFYPLHSHHDEFTYKQARHQNQRVGKHDHRRR